MCIFHVLHNLYILVLSINLFNVTHTLYSSYQQIYFMFHIHYIVWSYINIFYVTHTLYSIALYHTLNSLFNTYNCFLLNKIKYLCLYSYSANGPLLAINGTRHYLNLLT